MHVLRTHKTLSDPNAPNCFRYIRTIPNLMDITNNAISWWRLVDLNKNNNPMTMSITQTNLLGLCYPLHHHYHHNEFLQGYLIKLRSVEGSALLSRRFTPCSNRQKFNDYFKHAKVTFLFQKLGKYKPVVQDRRVWHMRDLVASVLSQQWLLQWSRWVLCLLNKLVAMSRSAHDAVKTFDTELF